MSAAETSVSRLGGGPRYGVALTKVAAVIRAKGLGRVGLHVSEKQAVKRAIAMQTARTVRIIWRGLLTKIDRKGHENSAKGAVGSSGGLVFIYGVVFLLLITRSGVH